MEDFNKKLFDAINNKDINFIDNINFDDSKLIDIKLFEKESDDPYYNYVKGLYYRKLGYDEENKFLSEKYYEKELYYFKLACDRCKSSKLYGAIGDIYDYFGNEREMKDYYRLSDEKYIEELNNKIKELIEENENLKLENEKLKLELSLIPGYGSEFKLAEKRYKNKDYQ